MIAHAALFTGVIEYLKNRDSLWGNRVYLDIAPGGAPRPYIIIFMVGGGERNAVVYDDAEFLLTIKVVADTVQESLSGAASLHNLLNDRGPQDVRSGGLGAIAGSGWTVLTITAERVVHQVELFENAQPIYHDGNQYRFVMEST